MADYMWIIWLSVFVISLIIETLTPELISIWFAFAGVISLIVSFIPEVEWWIQLIIFVTISITCILCIRPFLNKYFKRNKVDTNIDEIIHKRATLIKGYKENDYGELKLNGLTWRVVSQNNKEIEAGAYVEVVAIEGNKLIVKEIVKEK